MNGINKRALLTERLISWQSHIYERTGQCYAWALACGGILVATSAVLFPTLACRPVTVTRDGTSYDYVPSGCLGVQCSGVIPYGSSAK